MKEMINVLFEAFAENGYMKRKNSFWKIEDGFYKLIDFQKGAYGGNYFFVNICVHPVGLPLLSVRELKIIDRPNEYECIIRQRLENIVNNKSTEAFIKELVSVENTIIIQAIIDSLPEINVWLKRWGSFETIARSDVDEISNMLTVIPVLKKKAYLMLKYFCTVKLGDIRTAKSILSEYSNENVGDFNFQHVDGYMNSLVSNIE